MMEREARQWGKVQAMDELKSLQNDISIGGNEEGKVGEGGQRDLCMQASHSKSYGSPETPASQAEE